MDLRIAFFPLIRSTFDVALANNMIRLAREALSATGMELFGPAEPISDLSAAQAAAAELLSTSVDLILIFQATFADSTMVTALTENVDAPIFLWAVPEPWTGERLRLNSLCGINLAGHALTLRKRKYQYAYGLPQDPAVLQKIYSLAAAGALRRRLKVRAPGCQSANIRSGWIPVIWMKTACARLLGFRSKRSNWLKFFPTPARSRSVLITRPALRLDAHLDNLANSRTIPVKWHVERLSTP